MLSLILKLLWSVLLLKIILTDAASRKKRNPLSDYIHHYEELDYPKSYLLEGHSRVRRSLDPEETVHLNFKAHNRRFHLRLKRDTTLFGDGLSYTDSGFKPENIYKGFLEDDPLSIVHGFIFDDIFEGRVKTGDQNEFYIESVKQYPHLNDTKCHSVIYSAKDITHPEKHFCGGVKADTQQWMNKQQNHTVWEDLSSKKGSNSNDLNNYITFNKDDMIEVHDRKKRSAKFLNRQRRSFDTSKTECHLFMRADWTFSKWATGAERAMYLMTQYAQYVSLIYERTDFNNDGRKEQITLKIKKIETIDKCNNPDSSIDCQFTPENIGVEKFLDLASQGNHNAYCLSYVFAHRDFSGGVLGLAWIGDPGGSGGICDKARPYGAIMKTLNTGIVTNLNYGKTVTRKVTEITLAHEIGHNFGSQHDPTSGECAPGGTNGNFIMYPRATSGSDINNNLFSTCSKDYIWSVLESKSSCFEKRGAPICGNRIVEDGEECDCGYENERTCDADKCCQPSPSSGADLGNGCKFTIKAQQVLDPKLRCSPSLGFCCNPQTCKPYTDNNRVCAQNESCKAEAKCSPDSYKCPEGTHKPNLTLCNNDENVCVDGECSGSLCSLQNLDECQCSPEEDRCKVCCRSGNSSCTVLKNNDKHTYLAAGAPCNNYQGYCDILQKCRDVDADGPLSRLKNFLFSSQTFDTILDWMKEYWWACVLIGLGLVLIMAAFIACCSVHTPSSNPNKPPPRPMTLPRSLSRRMSRSRPSAPYDRQGAGGPNYHQGPPGYETAVRDSGNQRHMGYGGAVEMR